MGKVFGLIIGDTTMDVCIHEDNIVALILEETLPIQFTTQINNFVFKNWFSENMHICGVKLKKTATMYQLRDIFTKGLPMDGFEYDK